VAGGTRAALLAGEGDEHLVSAIATADPSEALVQVAAAGAITDRSMIGRQ